MSDIKQLLHAVITEAGEYASAHFGRLTPDDISYKYPNNRGIVTRVDMTLDARIRQRVLDIFPTHDIISEENESINNAGDIVWIIDPIDGTRNYVDGNPQYSISIGVAQGGELLMGAIYAPELDELFFAERGNTLLLNGKPVQPAIDEPITCYIDDKRLSRKDLKEVFAGCEQTHLGSVALELAYVAAGRSQGSLLENIMLWDIAAGMVMIEVMGGKLLNFEGKPYTLSDKHLMALGYHKAQKLV